MKTITIRWAWAASALALAAVGQATVLPTLAGAAPGRARLALHALITVADVALTVAVQCLSRWYDLLGNLL
jgi:hypothetical protein